MATFEFEGEGLFPISKVVQSSAVWMNNETITNAKLNASETKEGTDIILFYLSADNGSNFEKVTNGTLHYFTNTGTKLKWKARLTGYAGNSTYFENLRIEINKG